MRIFWGRGADAADTHTPNPVRRALLEAVKLGQAGPPFEGTVGPWIRAPGHSAIDDERHPEHPAGYIARLDGDDGDDEAGAALVHAVNAALVLHKPLLLTGSPGTGKSQLAQRVAWEFNLGPVLRFDSASLSEAGDLFYRYDLIGRLAALEQYKADVALNEDRDRASVGVARHLKFGPLGLAILRADPQQALPLAAAGLAPGDFKPADAARPSVVLIDEIDKTSRDFPNDMLNQIEDMSFKLRELGDLELRAPDTEAMRPIVLITSNSERELPAPFLRRCVYFHIPDPTPELLARILRSRVRDSGASGGGLLPLYADVLDFFLDFQREGVGSLTYQPGASELIDLARAVRGSGAADAQLRLSKAANLQALRRATATLIKHRADGELMATMLARWKPG